MSHHSPAEETIFAGALQRPTPAQRAAYLDEACAGDAGLRDRVETLLRASREAAAFLERPPGPPVLLPAGEPARATIKIEFPDAALVTEGPGTRIGRYKLLQQIGEGGCGTVFMAEQEEPVRRRVALKVIKLGMDTKSVVARFEAERQALAMMDHPNIAKVFDAGATTAGRPYFVMELVRGVAITKYCNEQHLDTAARLRIYLDVCAAVQHAHQKGIIHRDLKPSNILVTLRGDRPAPMVIDFGIAKATEQRLTDKTLFTAFEQFIGTPAYMSPEQAGLSGMDVDTRSDIYSLGVLLYELLTGHPPFDPKTLVRAGIEEIRRIIREDEPPRPSTRLSALKADDLTTLRRDHRIEPRQLAFLLRGDLDWVVMKSLEKDRTRRYDTASALASDLARYLKNEPVNARPVSTAYKLRKFVLRNRRTVAAAVTIATLLLGGVTATTWLAIVATRAQKLATREAVRSAEVAQFLKDMLEGVGPARARGRDAAMLREILDTAARRVGSGLTHQPEVEFELSATIGRTYMAVGSLAEAEKLQRGALELARHLYGEKHTNVVIVLDELGWTLRESGRMAEATNLLQQALTLSRNLVGDDHALTAAVMHRLGSVFSDLGQFAEAERLSLQAAEVLGRRLGPQNLRTLQARQNLAALYYQERKLAAMEPVALGALGDAVVALSEDHPLTLNLKAVLAILRQDQGRFDEAEKLHTEILASKRRILGEEHPNTLTSMDNLAIVYGLQGRFAEAEVLARAALGTYAKLGQGQTRKAFALQSNHAEYLRNLGRHAEAEVEFQRVIAAESQTMPATDPYLLETRSGLALLHEFRGRLPEAETILSDIVRIRRAQLPAGDLTLADSVAQLARILLARGRGAEAESLARESMAVSAAQRPDDWHRYAADSLVGACRLAATDPATAESFVRAGYQGLKDRENRIPAIDQDRLRESIERLVLLARAQGRSSEAAPWLQQLDQFNRSPAGTRLLTARGGVAPP